MFHSHIDVPGNTTGGYQELNTGEIREAIAYSHAHGLIGTEEALIDLLLTIEGLKSEGGSIRYRVVPGVT